MTTTLFRKTDLILISGDENPDPDSLLKVLPGGHRDSDGLENSLRYLEKKEKLEIEMKNLIKKN